jgi:hypothetical protein
VPVPYEIALELGELLYNARAAVDYSVRSLAWRGAGNEPEKRSEHALQFPVTDSPQRFQEEARRRLEGVRDDDVELIRQCQPWTGCRWTKLLQESLERRQAPAPHTARRRARSRFAHNRRRHARLSLLTVPAVATFRQAEAQTRTGCAVQGLARASVGASREARRCELVIRREPLLSLRRTSVCRDPFAQSADKPLLSLPARPSGSCVGAGVGAGARGLDGYRHARPGLHSRGAEPNDALFQSAPPGVELPVIELLSRQVALSGSD